MLEKSSDSSKDEVKSVDTPKFGEKLGDHSPPDNISGTGSHSIQGQGPMLQRRNSTTSI